MAYTFSLTVQYHANGGYNAPSSQTVTQTSATVPSNVFVTLTSYTPNRTGYDFLGWSVSASATSATYQPNDTYGYSFTASGSHTTTLYAVWGEQKSTIALHDGTTAATIDDSTTIDVTRYNNSYTHTITYAFGSATGTIATKSSSTSITWSVPASLANQIPNSTRGTCTLTCTTYNGNTSLGTITLNISLYVKQSVKQTIGTVTVSEGYGSMPSGISVYVQGKSKLTFSIANVSTGAYGATVASISTTVNGKTYSGASFTTDTIATAGSTSYTITLTDSRGRTDTKTDSVWVYQYHAPTPVITSVARDENTPSTAIVDYTWNISSVNSQNAKTLKIKYKLTTSSTWTQATSTTPSAYSGTGTNQVVSLNAAYPYNIQLELTDSFTTASFVLTLPSSGSRYIECSAALQRVKFPLDVQFVGSALTTLGDLSTTGDASTKAEPTSSSLVSGSWTNKANVQLTAGAYIVEYGCVFAQNQTGRREIVLSTSSTGSTATVRGATASANAVSGDTTAIGAITVISIAQTNTYYLNCYQNSGSSLTVYPWIRTVKII